MRRTPRPQWHSSHYALHNEELEKKRQTALLSESTINVRPSSVFEYEDDNLPFKIIPNVYYMPKKKNQVGLNSFILYWGVLYIFQFASGKEHPVKDGLLSFLVSWTGLPTQDNWRFIFVIPNDVEVLKCLALTHVDLQDLKLFSSVVVVEEDKWRGYVDWCIRYFFP